MFSGFNTQERRRSSMSHLSTNEKWRPRSASTGVIEVSPVTNFYSQRGPATPCFVSPRMAFSTQFNYDSPIQVLTSSSPGVFMPMSVPKIPRRYSLKRLPLKCKALLSTLLLSLAICLYVFRKSIADGNVDCNLTGSCGNHSHEHNDLQRFVRAVSGPGPTHHTLTGDLDDPEISIAEVHGNYEEYSNRGRDLPGGMFNQHGNGNGIAVIVGQHVDSSEEVVGNDLPGFSPVEPFDDIQESNHLSEAKTDSFSALESAPLAVFPPKMPARALDGAEYMQQGVYRQNQAPQMAEHQRYERPVSELDLMADMADHSGPYWMEAQPLGHQGDSSNRYGQMQYGYRETSDHRQHRRAMDNMRMDRLPPGINPRRYHEL
ncbi:uncharacterized protein [Palaemon carinicauda]|uniref:uncharacterized protein n=1 Tax=Palaemon carinicauda TaxID=392227 RepID=UPI0035B57EB2